MGNYFDWRITTIILFGFVLGMLAMSAVKMDWYREQAQAESFKEFNASITQCMLQTQYCSMNGRIKDGVLTTNQPLNTSKN